MLLPIAYSCPKLTYLFLPLGVGPELLQAFGSSSPHLTTFLTILDALAIDTLLQLSTLLPHLTSLTALRDTACRQVGTWEKSEVAICTALSACPKLQFFDLHNTMSASVWSALPHSLTSCVFSTTPCGCLPVSASTVLRIPMWPVHVNLRSLEIVQSYLSLSELSLMLLAAPSLTTIVSRDRTLFVTADGPADQLCLFSARLEAGLRIFMRDDTNGRILLIPSRMCVCLHLGDNPASSVMTASMQPLPGLTHIILLCHNVKADLSQLTRVFPCVREFKLSHATLDEVDLQILGSCSVLETLTLDACSGVTCAGLAGVCAASSTLKLVSCFQCRDMSAADGQSMGRERWGGLVTVHVGQGGHDGSWQN